MRGCSKQLLSSSFVCEGECFKRKTNLGEVNKPHTCSLSCSTRTKRLWKSVKIKTLFVTFLSIYHHYNLQITLTHIYIYISIQLVVNFHLKGKNQPKFLITDHS